MSAQASLRRYGPEAGSHRHAFLQLLFCTQGALELDLGGHAALVPVGAGFVLPVDAVHDFRGRDCRCVVLDLPFAALASLGADGRRFERPGFRRLSAGEQPLLDYVAAELARAPDDGLLQAALPALLLRLFTGDGPSAGRQRALPLAALEAYIDAHLAQVVTVAELAARCCLSAAHFQARFREETGVTVQAYVRQRRLRAALRLLDQGLPVAVVAGRVGYQSASAFTAALRREVGVTGREVRLGRVER